MVRTIESGDYQTGFGELETLLEKYGQIDELPELPYLSFRILALVLPPLGKFEALRKSFINLPYLLHRDEGNIVALLQSGAFILADRGEYTRAVSILSLGSTALEGGTGWLEHWDYYHDFVAQMRDQLGEAAYQIGVGRRKAS